MKNIVLGNTNGIERYAFISYNHQDSKWAKWLQTKLEAFKLPAGSQNDYASCKYLRPIFRDKTDLNTGVLADELRTELKKSKYLIVICSPHSAKSSWVSEEVKFFIELGRIEYIIPFIVEGAPHHYTGNEIDTLESDECFPYSLRLFTKNHPNEELLGISVKEVGKEKAFIRVVSKILGISFDMLWKRHERQLKSSRLLKVAVVISVLLTLGGVWYFNQPFDSKISISEIPQYNNLPFVEGKIGIYIDNEVMFDSITKWNDDITFCNIPSKYKNKNVRVTFSGYGFDTIDTLINLTSHIVLKIHKIP